MSKIKVAELFYSLQGEGQWLGTPSIFLRTFGCNFSCQGFSMPRGQLSTERLNVDPTQYTDYNALPLVHTGCDSYASWDPRFKHLSPMMEVSTVVDKIQELLPDGVFGTDKHLIITGGEPLLGWQRSYIDLLEEIKRRDMCLQSVTFETNGTQDLHDDLREYIITNDIDITFSVSSKLPSSGEKWEDTIKPRVVHDYALYASTIYFKWVVSSPDDVADVHTAISKYMDFSHEFEEIPIYLMAAGGTTKHYNENEKWVADVCMKNGWRYSPRLQVQLWKNAWGT